MQELLEKYWKWAALGALTLLAGFLAVCAARRFLAAAAAAAPTQPPLPIVEQQYTDYPRAAYLLREQGGYVAVFTPDSPQPIEITGIPVSSLRSADRSLLSVGIAAADREDLLKLLEDFSS